MRLAVAQGEYQNWYFGQQADLVFSASTAPRPQLNSAMTAPSACATLSDAAGNLLLYTNGEQVWNQRHQVVPGGNALGGNSQVAQGVGLLRRAGGVIPLAYLFTQRYTQPIGFFSTGVPCVAEIQLATPTNPGQVVRTGLPVVADSILQRLGEQRFAPYQAFVRHANGRDMWVLTRLHEQGIFLASLLDGTGTWPCARTVVSRVLPRRVDSSATWCGALVASPDGRILLYNDVASSYMLRFDPATGNVSGPQRLSYPAPTIPANINPYALGAAFSSDGRLAYLTRLYQPGGNNGPSAVQVLQYDFATGAAAAVAASGIQIYNVTNLNSAKNLPYDLQRGPNGIVYLAVPGAPTLDAILSPNARGRACRYTAGYQDLRGRLSLQGLPLQPNYVNLGPLLGVEPAYACAGQVITMRAGANAGGIGTDSLRWLLGDGRAAVRTLALQDTFRTAYPAAGTYTLRVERRRQGAVIATATATVSISASPRVRLATGPDTAGCAPLNLLLSTGSQPAGTVFSWQDGSTAATLVTTAPGIYWVDIQNRAGCIARDSVLVRETPCGELTATGITPNIITPNADGQNDTFAPTSLVSPGAWSLAVFDRWGRRVFAQAAYDNQWAATGLANGLYFYYFHHGTSGRKLKGWVEVRR